ncbi:hypothetical protein M406DRAFT_294704 [Cryphonectria parasitica EP155]|uniref:Organic solute transporter Ostalpha-domain-containing protein n=1 Tax=Cryphonectria parasitica (strain ATCC 38755 / EP155) TaxID=660469 RepID=A0A9P5CMB0_CRYP1|nr:uncharacterized protein M406DRAFT_294704 [Cryphonectria parasitica EP155]KAF3762906.1 hypothetical protein M406DRAFT_294704 [Cryphonectria parasitica EP155]
MLNTETATLAGGMDFSTINKIITGACALFVLLSLLVLMFRHATHFSRPNEQLHIMRICCYLPIFSIGCFLQVSFPNAYVYLNPWLDFAQAVALCNFFLMMCQFVSPSDSQRELFFAALKQVNDEPVNGLHWYRRMFILIFQYPVVQAVVSILTAITESQGVYCLVSSKPHFAHLWLDIVHTASLAVAVMACLRLLSGLRGQLKHHRPLLKLAAFKLLIAITGLIQLIYWILRTVKPTPLKPTASLSFADDFIGIPVLVMALLTVPFSILFHFAYDVQTYYLENVDKNLPLTQRDAEAGSSYQGGFLGIWAWLGMLNPSELISGLRFGLTMLNRENREMGVDTVRRAQTGEFDN